MKDQKQLCCIQSIQASFEVPFFNKNWLSRLPFRFDLLWTLFKKNLLFYDNTQVSHRLECQHFYSRSFLKSFIQYSNGFSNQLTMRI